MVDEIGTCALFRDRVLVVVYPVDILGRVYRAYNEMRLPIAVKHRAVAISKWAMYQRMIKAVVLHTTETSGSGNKVRPTVNVGLSKLSHSTILNYW